MLSGSRCVHRSECGCERDGLYYALNETFWVGPGGEVDSECFQRCVCGLAGKVTCLNESCQEGEVCTVEVGMLGCYPRRDALCSLSQMYILSTFDGSSMSFPDESSFYLVKTLGRLPSNVSAVEVKIGRKLVNKGPAWKRPVVIRVQHLETQIGGSDFDIVKV